MKTRKNFVGIAISTLLLSCLGSMIVTTRSVGTDSKNWNIWADINFDGTVDIYDAIQLANAYGSSGDSINKTALLLECNATYASLMSRMDYLNASFIGLLAAVEGMNATNLMPLINDLNSSLLQLQSNVTALGTTVTQLQTSNASLWNSLDQLASKVENMNVTIRGECVWLQAQIDLMSATIASMNQTVAQLQNSNADLNSRVNALEGNFSILLSRVNALEINSSSAIPSNSTYTYSYDATSEAYGWVDMNYMSVSLRVNRTSNLMILFSTDAYCTTGPSESTYIYIQALVNSSYVNPNYVTLNPNVQVTGFSFLPAHAHYMSAGAYSFIFNMPSVAPGFYTIKIQWQVSYGSPQGTGYVGYRTLTAIALPT